MLIQKYTCCFRQLPLSMVLWLSIQCHSATPMQVAYGKSGNESITDVLADASKYSSKGGSQPVPNTSLFSSLMGFIQARYSPVLLDEAKIPEYSYKNRVYRCCRGSCCCQLPCGRCGGRVMSRWLTGFLVLTGVYSLATTWTDWDPLDFDGFTKSEITGSLCIVPDINNATKNDTTYVGLPAYGNETYDRAARYYNATQSVYQYGFDVYTGTGSGDATAHTWPKPDNTSSGEIEAELSLTCRVKKCLFSKKGLFGTNLDCKRVSVPCGDYDRVEILLENQENEILLSTYEEPDENVTLNSTSPTTELEDTLYEEFETLSDRLTTGTSIYPLYKALMIFLGPGYLIMGGGIKYRAKKCAASLNKIYFALLFTLSWYLYEYSSFFQDLQVSSIAGLEDLIPTLCYAAADGYVEEIESRALVCDKLAQAEFLVEQGIDSVTYYSTVEGTYEYSQGIYDNLAGNLSFYKSWINSTAFDCDLESFIDALDSEFALSVKWLNLRLFYKALLPILVTGMITKGFQLFDPLCAYNGRFTLAQNHAKPFHKAINRLAPTQVLTDKGGGLPEGAQLTRAGIERFIWLQSILPFMVYTGLLIYIITDLSQG